MPKKYVWMEWGIKPTSQDVIYSGDNSCRNCEHDLFYSGYISTIVGFSPFAPKASTMASDGALVVQCQYCQTLSWWHARKLALPDLVLDSVPNCWPTEE